MNGKTELKLWREAMKRLILTIATLFVLAESALAQCPPRQVPKATPQPQRGPEDQQICLESFEMCNNWARHYCYAGGHERRVNEILRQMKERGVTITTAIIKSVAKRTMKQY
jgi:hypothetical protein